MLMELIRVYKNDTDTIRIDVLSVSGSSSLGRVATFTADNGDSLRIGPRKKTTQLIHSTGVARTIDGIEIIGDYDAIDTVSGNYTYATKTLGSGQVVRIDMSDLPQLGDSV
jgi:hypothetical protein